MAVAAQRAPRFRPRRRRLAVVAAVTAGVLVAGGAIATATVFPTDGEHERSAAPAAVRLKAPPSAPLVSRSAASPWRTQWALSLDHPGALPGTRLTCRMVTHVALSGSQIGFKLIKLPVDYRRHLPSSGRGSTNAGP